MQRANKPRHNYTIAAKVYAEAARYAHAMRLLRDKINRGDWPKAEEIRNTVFAAQTANFNALRLAFPDPTRIVAVEHLCRALRCVFPPSKIRD